MRGRRYLSGGAMGGDPVRAKPREPQIAQMNADQSQF